MLPAVSLKCPLLASMCASNTLMMVGFGCGLLNSNFCQTFLHIDGGGGGCLYFGDVQKTISLKDLFPKNQE